MAERYLSDGSLVLLDDCDTDLWDRYVPWTRSGDGYAHAYVPGSGRSGQRHIKLHSLIAQRMGLTLEPDHKNRNSLDDRRENLRSATRSQNIANSGPRVNNTSGYKGVTLYRPSGKWQAKIKVNGRGISLGYYHDKVEAARAYNRAALKYFGEFAYLNPV